MKVRHMGANLFYADGQTDVHRQTLRN